MRVEVKKIRYWSALIGRSSRLKNSHSDSKLFPCGSWPNISLQTNSNQNQMKNTEVEKIYYWLALVGQLGRSKNSRSHFKNILCCSFLNVLSAKTKLLELEHFAWPY